MQACLNCNEPKEVLQIYERMMTSRNLKPNEITLRIVLEANKLAQDFASSEQTFKKLQQKQPSSQNYKLFLSVCAVCKKWNHVDAIYKQLKIKIYITM
eukprot:UN27342